MLHVALQIMQVPTKKLKKYEKEYQAMRENQLQQEDPMDRYKVWRHLALPREKKTYFP